MSGLLDELGKIAGAVIAEQSVDKLDPDAGFLEKAAGAFAGYEAAKIAEDKLDLEEESNLIDFQQQHLQYEFDLSEEQIKLINKIGSNGIACLGLATEVQKLSFKEKKIIIELIANNCNYKIPTAITIQGNTFDEYVKLIEIARFNQASWIILQPLLKTKNTSEEHCYNFYKKLIPYSKDTIVGIQNAIEYIGVGLTPKKILKLYKSFPNFRVIKGEASSVFIQKEISQYPKDLYIFK